MLRWLGVTVVTIASFLVLETPVILAGVVLGLFWGIVFVATGSVIISAAAVTLAPQVSPVSPVGRLLYGLREWAAAEVKSPYRVVRWAYKVGAGFGFVVSSIFAGPIVTSVMVSTVRGERRTLWPVILASSIIFAVVAVSFYTGAWTVVRQLF